MSRGKHRASRRAPRRAVLPAPAQIPARVPARRLALVLAPVATAGVVAAGVAVADVPHGGGSVLASRLGAQIGAGLADGAADSRRTADLGSRTAVTSRSADRMTPAAGDVNAAPAVVKQLWTTEQLDLRTAPDEGARVTGEVPANTRIGLTGQSTDGFAAVVVHDRLLWVHGQYLAATKSTDPADLPLATGPCPGTASVENGLVPRAITVYQAVCHDFPQITRYLGRGPRPEHDTGHAIDIMTTDTTLGYRIAAFLQAHASELDLYDIIYRQHIWTPVRASEGWRLMPDRGSATANHMDHVHVAVN